MAKENEAMPVFRSQSKIVYFWIARHAIKCILILSLLWGELLCTTPGLASLPPPAPANGNLILFSKPGSQGDCSSWVNACSLQTALGMAAPGDQVWVAEGVYIPTLPTNPAEPRSVTFMLPQGVAIYGGFGGTETSLETRDWTKHISVLSGDQGGDDLTDPNGVVTNTANLRGQNAFNVVSSQGVTQTARLDGFTITAGQANGSSCNEHGCGGGMFNSHNSSPTLTHLIFSGNLADLNGGGMYNQQSSPGLVDVVFRNNHAFNEGGGMDNYQGSPTLENVNFRDNLAAYNGGGMTNRQSSPTLVNVTFRSNQADYYGGGLANYDASNPSLSNVDISENRANEGGGLINNHSHPSLVKVTISSNQAFTSGGGMSNAESSPNLVNVTFIGNIAFINGGGISNYMSSPRLTNVLFINNQADHGGGILNYQSSNPILAGVSFSSNHASSQGGGMWNANSYPLVYNSIFWGNTAPNKPHIFNNNSSPTITYSDVQGALAGGVWDASLGTDGGGNIDADPHFVRNPDPGLDGIWGTQDDDRGDQRMTGTSPAIDAGNDSLVPLDIQDLDGDLDTSERLPFDLTGNPRLVDHFRPDSGLADLPNYPEVVDMGACETPQNHAPLLDISGDPTLDDVVAGSPNPGTDITTLIGRLGDEGISDLDPGTVEGLALIGSNHIYGEWQFSIDGGSSWTPLGTISENTSVLLTNDAFNRVRFLPAPGFRGILKYGLTFRAWDQVDGRPNGSTGIDVSTNGDPTAYSLSSETARITVNNPFSQNAYQNDFSHPIGNEWSCDAGGPDNRSIAPNGEVFLGEFGNQTACLNLPNNPQHNFITISLDMYVIRSWNGNQTSPQSIYIINPQEAIEGTNDNASVGPDIWRFQAAGQTMLNTTFSNSTNHEQAFPGSYPGTSYPAQTGARYVDALGYLFNGHPRDASYHLTFNLPHTSSNLELSFTALGLGNPANESWGLDNILVTLLNSYLVYLPLTLH